MVLGDQIQGIFTHGWRFVTDDALRISQRVREENPDARLAAQPDTHQLGVVEWFRREFMPGGKEVDELVKAPITGRGGCWYLSLRIYDEAGEPYCGAPDARVIEQMQKADRNKKDKQFNVGKFIAEVEAISERAREKWVEETTERFLEPAEMEQHFILKSRGERAPKIYVPKGVA